MEQICVAFSIAACISHAAIPVENPESQYNASSLSLALSTDNAKCKELCHCGLADIILGWDESAREHFERALEEDSSCALACAALLFLNGDNHSLREQLKKITCESTLLPQELFFVEVFLKLARKEYLSTAQLLNERANKYRADKISAVWGTLLLYASHIPYDPETGEASENQIHLLQKIDSLYKRFPNDGIVAYLRAYIESASHIVSPVGFEAAKQSVTLLSNHPAALYLYAHYLFKKGMYSEAADVLNNASLKCAQRGIELSNSELWWKSRLYQVYALQCIDTNDDNVKKLVQLLHSSPIHNSNELSAVSLLRQWEIDTLPLRLLSTPGTTLSARLIAGARKDNTNSHASVREVKNCLASCLYARFYTSQGRIKDAQKSLALAQQAKEKFDQSFHSVTQESTLLLTPWYRAQESCTIAINLAQAEVYPSTKELWVSNAQKARTQSYVLLPPTIIIPPSK